MRNVLIGRNGFSRGVYCGSSAHLTRKRAKSGAAQQVPLQDEDNDKNGREIDRANRSEDAPINADISAHDPDHGDRDGTCVLAREEQAEEEIVPRKDEGDHRRRGDPGADLREAYFRENRKMGTAVEPSRFLDLSVQFVKKAS